MEIEIISQDNQELVFRIEGVEVSLVNALRRIVMVEVPTLAIEEVLFLKTKPAYSTSPGPPAGDGALTTDLEAITPGRMRLWRSLLPLQCLLDPERWGPKTHLGTWNHGSRSNQSWTPYPGETPER